MRHTPRIDLIAFHVKHCPGQTAHALAPLIYGQYRPRWGYVYDAFMRARAHGKIVSHWDATKKVTRYYPPAP